MSEIGACLRRLLVGPVVGNGLIELRLVPFQGSLCDNMGRRSQEDRKEAQQPQGGQTQESGPLVQLQALQCLRQSASSEKDSTYA